MAFEDLVKTYFSPVVGVVTTANVDEACAKNNLNFCEILEPFLKVPLNEILKSTNSAKQYELESLTVRYLSLDQLQNHFVRDQLQTILEQSLSQTHIPLDKLPKLRDRRS